MKRLITLLVLLSIRVISIAQEVNITQQNNSYASFVTNTFQYVNTSHATTGFLIDRAFPMTNMDYWNGTNLTDSTNMDLGRFSPLYLMLETAKVGTQTFPTFDVLSSATQTANSANLALVYCKYNQFRTDAVTANLMQVINNQLYDVAGRTQSPYLEKEVFAATALQYDFTGGTISFTLPSSKLVSNISPSITTLTVDWGNGAGNQTYTVGQTVSVTYPTSGKKLVTIQFTKPNGSILKSRFEINVGALSGSGASPLACSDPNYAKDCIFEQTITADRAFQGVLASAKVTISFACPDQKLRKPFIILDGFEPDFFKNTAEFKEVLKIMQVENSPTGNALGVDLKAAGYDLVFVDWNNRQDFIQRNAFLLQKILQFLKTKKQDDGSGSSEKNVIMGLSMGGIIGKYALRDLELLNPTASDGGHDTRLFITFDSPLQGANIPLGLQHMLSHLANSDVFFVPLKNKLKDANGNPFLEGALNSLNSNAARQMVIFQASASSSFSPADHIAFYNELNTLGAPTKCDYKNISNGSATGVINFAAGSRMLHNKQWTKDVLQQALKASGFWAWVATIGATIFGNNANIDLQVFALADRDPNFKVIYDGKISYSVLGIPFLNFFKVEVKNARPLDNGPGGTTSLVTGQIATSEPPLSPTFIPIASALDVRSPENQNINLNVSNEQTFLASGLSASKGFVGARGVGNGTSSGGFSNSDNASRFQRNGDLIFTGPNNQEHVSLSYRFTGFLLYELTQRTSLASVPNFTLNNRTYNFGSSDQPYSMPQVGQSVPKSVKGFIDFPLIVSGTGQLYVNRNGKIEFTDIPTNPNNTINSRYNLDINKQGCNSTTPSITLQSGGKMRAGDGVINNFANVTVWSGATINVNAGGEATYEGGSNLIVENGGVVNINNGGLQDAQFGGNIKIKSGGILHVWNSGTLRLSVNSILEIENGGQLIIDAGANIQLWDGNNGPGGTTIDGRCAIKVKNGGQLIINGQFNLDGNGYFGFEQGNVLTLNSDILLRGYATNIQMIRIGNGASMVINGRKLTLENGLVRRDNAFTANSKHIKLINGASIQATNVIFEDGANYNGTFIYAENPTDPDNSTTDVDFGFTNCTFNNTGQALELNTLNNGNFGPFDWRDLTVDFTNCTINGGTAMNANRCRTAVFLNCQLLGSSITLGNAYWLDMRGTTMRGNGANTGIRLQGVIHGEIYDNSTIDNYGTGIEATEGSNYGVKLMSGAKVQNCYKAVNLTGGLQNAQGYDWGMMYMDCASLIDNVYGITGKDIQFNMYGRSGTTVIQNVTNPNITQNFIDWRYVDAEFEYRNFTTDVWFHNSYWTGGVAPNWINGIPPSPTNQFRFFQRTPQRTPWTGMLHLDNPIIDGNDVRIDPCGGLLTRGNDPFEGKSDITLNGGRYNTKVQHDAAMVKMRKKDFDDAVTLFKPLAHVPKVIYERSSPEARFFIDNARIWVSSKGLNTREANDGWLPQAFVGFVNKTTNLFILKPNPAQSEFEIQLLTGNYEISIFDALGKLIFTKNTEGVTPVNTAEWQNGIYFVSVQKSMAV